MHPAHIDQYAAAAAVAIARYAQAIDFEAADPDAFGPPDRQAMVALLLGLHTYTHRKGYDLDSSQCEAARLWADEQPHDNKRPQRSAWPRGDAYADRARTALAAVTVPLADPAAGLLLITHYNHQHGGARPHEATYGDAAPATLRRLLTDLHHLAAAEDLDWLQLRAAADAEYPPARGPVPPVILGHLRDHAEDLGVDWPQTDHAADRQCVRELVAEATERTAPAG